MVRGAAKCPLSAEERTSVFKGTGEDAHDGFDTYGAKGDAVECGRIIHSAFAAIAAHHNSPPDFPSAEVGTRVASMLIDHPRFYGIVAETGKIVGSNFLGERSRH